MLKKTITYEDFDGVSQTEEFYFHLSKAELLEMEVTTPGGYGSYLESIVKSVDMKDPLSRKNLVEAFKAIILTAYGKRSDDGKRFIKSETISEEFVQTPAYSQLFWDLLSDADIASDFVNGIMPVGVITESKDVAVVPQDRKPKKVKTVELPSAE
jgi:hypothetical protein